MPPPAVESTGGGGGGETLVPYRSTDTEGGEVKCEERKAVDIVIRSGGVKVKGW